MAKTTQEKLEAVQAEIQQLENQKKKLVQEQKEQERKLRTRRLIERGAILESLINGAAALTNEQVKAFLEKTIQTECAQKTLAGLKAPQAEPAAENQSIIPTQPITE